MRHSQATLPPMPPHAYTNVLTEPPSDAVNVRLLDLPSNQDIDLETGVYDPESGKAGTLSIALHPPTTTASASAP